MKGKAIIPLVLGLLVGLVAVKYLVDTLQKARGANAQRKTITALRAKEDIDSYQVLTADLVEQVEVPDSDLIPVRDRIATLEDVVGRVTAKSIPQNSPILASMLAPEGTPPGMVGRIPPGFRAVSVRIDEVAAVAFQIKPGDWVDVIVVMDVDSVARSRAKETIAEVILQNVQVAAIGQGASQPKRSGGSSVKPAKSATLFVREKDVPKLHLAGTRGKITLSMRGADDTILGTPTVARGSEVFTFMQGDEKPFKPATGPTSGLSASEPSFLQQMMEMMAQRPQPTKPAGPIVQEPHGVIVFHTSLTEESVDKVERITFADPHSRKILAVSEGSLSQSQGILAASIGQGGSAATTGRSASGAKETK